MRILAIETSGRHGSVALLQGAGGDAQQVRQSILSGNQRTAQSLVPAIDDLLTGVGWPAQSIELVAVAVGPGSFTGLRIGVTTAKTLAYAVGAEVIGVHTLVALASQVPPDAGRLWTILDAQRQELFVAQFEPAARADFPLECDTSIVPHADWLRGLRPGERVVGPPLRRLASQLPEGVVPVPEACWQLLAEAVGKVAWRDYCRGRRDDLWQLVPNYYRPSYAEEKRPPGDGGT